jgi:vacuolar protein sorting-associated protein 1
MSPFRGGVYDLQSQKYIHVVQKLRTCGLEEVIKLPKIAVIGNQSAGKSSLLEAISQIRLPRASGTCTRCPMEIALRRGDPENWSCTVSLRFENSKHGSIEFGTTTSKDAVTDLLRRAQLAILNPNAKVEDFYNLTEIQCKDYSKALNFSKDIVVLEIIGADVDVTFVDLPGIIARTDKVYPSLSPRPKLNDRVKSIWSL